MWMMLLVFFTTIGSLAMITFRKSGSDFSSRSWISSVHPPRRVPELLLSQAVTLGKMKLLSMETLNYKLSKTMSALAVSRLGILIRP